MTSHIQLRNEPTQPPTTQPTSQLANGVVPIRRGEPMKIELFVNWVHFLREFGTNLRKESLAPRVIVNSEALKEGFRTNEGPARRNQNS